MLHAPLPLQKHLLATNINQLTHQKLHLPNTYTPHQRGPEVRISGFHFMFMETPRRPGVSPIVTDEQYHGNTADRCLVRIPALVWFGCMVFFERTRGNGLASRLVTVGVGVDRLCLGGVVDWSKIL